MKAQKPAKLDFKYVLAILITLLVIAVFGYQLSQPVPENKSPGLIAASVKPAKAVTTPKGTGAACCKASFSRSKMLSVKNSSASIAPSSIN